MDDILAAFNSPLIEGLVLLKEKPYDVKDVEVIGCFVQYLLVVLVTRSDSGISSVQELVALAKKAPQGLVMGANQRSNVYLQSVNFNRKIGISDSVRVVTYRSLSLMLSGLLGTDGLAYAATFGGLVYPLVQKGKLKMLATFSPNHSTLAELERIPTLKEVGIAVEPVVNFMGLAVRNAKVIEVPGELFGEPGAIVGLHLLDGERDRLLYL